MKNTHISKLFAAVVVAGSFSVSAFADDAVKVSGTDGSVTNTKTGMVGGADSATGTGTTPVTSGTGASVNGHGSDTGSGK